MKNKAYFIKNLARIKGLPEDDPWIQEFQDKHIVDILMEIKKVREDQQQHKGEEPEDDSLWSRLFGS